MNARLDDDDLRAAWRADAEIPASAECPTAEELWDGAHGALDRNHLRRMLDHLASCGTCAEEWRLAVDVGGAGAEQAADAFADLPVAPAAGGAPRRWWVGVAAAAVLAVVLGLGVQEWRESRTTVYRDGEETVLRARIADGAALPRDAFELRWEAPAGAVEYHLQVTTEELRPVAVHRGLTEPRQEIPAGALAGLPDGTRLYWQVAATFETGDSEVSPTYAVEIAPARGP